MRPGAPSETTSSGPRRPRATSPLRNPAQASVDSDDPPSRPTNTGWPSVVIPHAANTGSGAVVHLEMRTVQEEVLEGDGAQVPAFPGIELGLDRLADPAHRR